MWDEMKLTVRCKIGSVSDVMNIKTPDFVSVIQTFHRRFNSIQAIEGQQLGSYFRIDKSTNSKFVGDACGYSVLTLVISYIPFAMFATFLFFLDVRH